MADLKSNTHRLERWPGNFLITGDAMSLSQCKEGNKERMSVSVFTMGVLYCFYVFIREVNWKSKGAALGQL